MNENTLIINTDGGSRGNPGKSASAFVVNFKGNIIKQQSKYIGISTNNIAEYQAVLIALQWLAKNIQSIKCDNAEFLIDSELVVKQLKGIYKIKNINIQNFVSQIKKFENSINISIGYRNIPREENKIADLLVNRELDSH